MTDTPESVCKLASIFDSEGCDAEANILRRYAYLLEQIKKAPISTMRFNDGFKRVALLQVEKD